MNFNNTLSFPSLLLPLPVSLFITPSLPSCLPPSSLSLFLLLPVLSLLSSLSPQTWYTVTACLQGRMLGKVKRRGRPQFHYGTKWIERHGKNKSITVYKGDFLLPFLCKFLLSINYCVSISYSIFIIYYSLVANDKN